MSLKSFLYLTVAVLPVAIAGCADSASEMRAIYGDTTWTAEELTSTPYDRAKQHFSDGRYGLAVKHFEIALSQDPDSVEALNGLAASFDQLQRYELSERFYLRALNLDPQNGQTVNNLGYSYLIQGRYDLALTYLYDALALDPMNDRVQDNLQQAKVGLELEGHDFLASAVGSADYEDVMASPRSTTLRTQESQSAATPARDVPPEVQIRAMAARDDIWVERTSPAVQTLITQPSPGLLLAMRDASLPPRIANFRNQAAVVALQTQPAPWQTTHLIIAEAMVERELTGAISQDRLLGGSPDTPIAAPTVAVETGELPSQLVAVIDETSVEAFSDLPQLSAAIIETGPMSDALPITLRSAETNAGELDSKFGDFLPQLSAELIHAANSPVDRDGSADETEQTVLRQKAVPAYEAVATQPSPVPHDDLPALPPGSDEAPVIEVSNGAGRLQMAFRISEFLEAEGVKIDRLTNAEHFSHQETIIFYRREWLQEARELAQHLPVEATLVAASDLGSDIRIQLGGDLLNFDQGLFYASRESSVRSRG